MGLRINNNVAALMAQRNMARSDAQLSQSLERLSSGLRISRAAADPAGLVISEQQRAQIAGFNQAVENSERGISMVQTAEGQLSEINALLIKMRGLVLDAANDAVNDADSLAADQAEIRDAVATIDRIAQTARFGAKILFDGSNSNSVDITNTVGITAANSTYSTGIYDLAVSGWTAATYAIDATGAAAMNVETTAATPAISGLTAGDHVLNVTVASAAASMTGTAAVDAANLDVVTGTNDEIKLTVTDASGDTSATLTLAQATYADADALATQIQTQIAGSALADLISCDDDGNGAITFTGLDEGSTSVIKIEDAGNGQNWMDTGVSGFSDQDSATGTDGVIELDGYGNTVSFIDYSADTTVSVQDISGNTLNLDLSDGADTGLRQGAGTLTVTQATGNITVDGGTAVSFTAGEQFTLTNAAGETIDLTVGLDATGNGTDTLTVVDNSLVFQVGPNAGQTAKLSLANLNTSQLGTGLDVASGGTNQFANVSEIDVTSLAKATDSLAIVDAVITEISSMRGDIGSFQANTLESNLSALRVAAENLTAAESVIRDTDFSVEVAEFTKQQILTQAGASVLSSANQIPQIVLQLFR